MGNVKIERVNIGEDLKNALFTQQPPAGVWGIGKKEGLPDNLSSTSILFTLER